MAQGKAEYYLEDSVLTFYIGHTRIKVLSFNKVGSGKNIYSRTHAKNHYELHYVLKGDGMIDVGDEKYALKRGTLYVTGPGLIYRKSGGKNDSVYEYEMTLRIEEDGCEGELSKILSSKSFFLCEGLTDCEICFRSAERELIEHNGFYMESIENNLKQIIIMLLRKYGVSMPYIPLPKAEKEDKCCLITDMEFIFNIRELTLEGLSNILGLSKRQCQRFIEDNYGMSYSEKLLQARMIKASDYLIYTDKDIQAIGEEVGYSGSSYFTRVFKRHFGITPREYRKTNKEKL